MKFIYTWKKKQDPDEIEIISHPRNKDTLLLIEEQLSHSHTIIVKNMKNDRAQKLSIHEIEAISSLGHLSKVRTVDGEEYFLHKKLKELTHLEKYQLYRINNATIFNLSHIDSFVAGSYARLEVFTKTQQVYTVSRHYAKYVKERFM